MKKVIIGAAVVALALAALRRFGPALGKRAMSNLALVTGATGRCVLYIPPQVDDLQSWRLVAPPIAA